MPRLAYYGQQWPFPQGAAAGPYPQFAGPLRGMSPEGACTIMVGRRMIQLSPGKRPRPCPCPSHAGKIRARHRHLGAMGDAGLPAGSELVYDATWDLMKARLLDPFITAAKVTNDTVAQLGSQGIVVEQSPSSQTFTTGVMKLQVKTITDRNSPEDVKSIINGVIYGLINQMPTSSISPISQQIPSTPAGTPIGTDNSVVAQEMANAASAAAAGDTALAQYWTQKAMQDSGITPSFDLVTWISSNWMWVAGAGVGLLVLRKVM